MEEGRKPEYPEKTPGDELQKMPHTKDRRIKPLARLEPPQWHWWQARKADALTVTPRVMSQVSSTEGEIPSKDAVRGLRTCAVWVFLWLRDFRSVEVGEEPTVSYF